jgi:hypothetical protein
MNAATKTKIATALTGVTGFIVALQSVPLSVPPFTAESVKLIGGGLAFLSILFTYLKQSLSAEVTNQGKNLTFLIIGLPALLIGTGDFIGLFNIHEPAAHWITWSISSLLMLVNIYSKLLFPSGFQKDKIAELKTVDVAKTQ